MLRRHAPRYKTFRSEEVSIDEEVIKFLRSPHCRLKALRVNLEKPIGLWVARERVIELTT